jgi:hypothetical protein
MISFRSRGLPAGLDDHRAHPMTWKRRGGRKVIIAPNGGDAWAPAKPRRTRR